MQDSDECSINTEMELKDTGYLIFITCDLTQSDWILYHLIPKELQEGVVDLQLYLIPAILKLKFIAGQFSHTP